jgi:hypothetical protein
MYQLASIIAQVKLTHNETKYHMSACISKILAYIHDEFRKEQSQKNNYE